MKNGGVAGTCKLTLSPCALVLSSLCYSRVYSHQASVSASVQNNRLAYPLWTLAPSGKSWISHCNLSFKRSVTIDTVIQFNGRSDGDGTCKRALNATHIFPYYDSIWSHHLTKTTENKSLCSSSMSLTLLNARRMFPYHHSPWHPCTVFQPVI